MRYTAAIVATVALLGLATAGPAQAGAPSYTPGRPGVGDPYYPLEGNGGYDVGHYDLDLDYDPATHHLDAVAALTATATQGLSRFDLDLSGLRVRSVTVDGDVAAFARVGQELQITPPHGIDSGSTFAVAVRYDGSPRTIVGAPAFFGAPYGWIYTQDGVFVGDEPDGARTWFPGNDHPSDKATYTFRVTVPRDRKVVANGELRSTTFAHGRATYVWDETTPMASYLATIDIGRWDIRTGTTPAGRREIMAVDPKMAPAVARAGIFRRTGVVTDFWADIFGPYPFTSTGAIIDKAPSVLFSLETQTRPVYSIVPLPVTLAHELAHQWFGDSVSVRDWRDTWLNEGFAVFAQDLWTEHTGGRSTYEQLRGLYDSFIAEDPFWQTPVADPGPDQMFGLAVYLRGAMTLGALRHRIGDAAFFTLLRRWTATYRNSNASTADFVRLADDVTGQHLDGFFHEWLYAPTRPASFG